MALDLTSFAFSLKQYYTDARVREMVYKNNPLHALLPKMENFLGENMPTPLIYGNPQSRSATFGTAQSLSSSSNTKGVKFIITRVKDYAIATVDNETMEASEGNAGAFLEAATTEFDGAINSLTRSLAIAEYGDGSGTIGRANATPANSVSSFVLQLQSPESVTNFEVGMSIVIYSAASGGSQRTSDGTQNKFTILAVNRDTGALTLSGTYSSSGSIVASDYIFNEGDRGLKLAGLAAWLPTSAPSSTPFFGVDRSVDTTRLGGVRFDGSALPIEEALIQAVRRAEREGAALTHIFMNHLRWSQLETALGSKVIYCTEAAQDMPSVGFRGIQIQGTKGPIKVIADQNCPDGLAYALQIDTWQLCSLGRAVRVIDSDGLPVLRQTSADGVEGRYVYYAQLRCFAPGYNAVITLPS